MPKEAPAARKPEPTSPIFWSRRRVTLAAIALLAVHGALAVASLLRENPTVDEVVHLPAGVSYWQKGTFKLYRHNPPLIKLIAALPVVLSGLETGPIYASEKGWQIEYPSQALFAQYFLIANVGRYLELFALARLVMPLFSLLGGLVVFAWSRRLYGSAGGLLSLALWCFCPNVLAHARLVTTDVGATALGCGATYLFWRYLHEPSWRRASFAGIVLGLVQLAKFSLLLLYFLWPLIWLAHEIGPERPQARWRRIGRAFVQGTVIVVWSVLVIDAGYLFEGVGTPLGQFDFASRSPLTRPTTSLDENHRAVVPSLRSGNPLIDVSWRHRINRFRGTGLGSLPSPLPRHYLLGFDEQKIEADALPAGWIDPNAPPDAVSGYPVYLDGVLRRHGWWYYYLMTLFYKVPEGTWLLVGLGVVVTLFSRRARASWADEFAVWLVPVVVLAAMSFLTDINLGLRYILPMFPYVFIATGKLAPWAAGLSGRLRNVAVDVIGAALLAPALATALVYPSFLAYFNWVSGGPRHGHEHLIDSNLDWGQDLVTLRDWLREHPQDRPIGLAYFGQLSPNIFKARGDGFDWSLPPVLPIEYDLRLMPSMDNVADIVEAGKDLIIVAATKEVLHFRIFDRDGRMVVDIDEMELTTNDRRIKGLRKQLGNLWPPHELTEWEKARVIDAVTTLVGYTLPRRFERLVAGPKLGPAPRLEPGLYAVSASLLRGLPWRVYDPYFDPTIPTWVSPGWSTDEDAFGYFRELTPLPESLGYSILLYQISPADAARLNAKYWPGGR